MKSRLPALAAILLFLFASSACPEPSPVEQKLPPDLVDKWNAYIVMYQARHIDRGGTIEAILDAESKSQVVRYYGHGDTQGWTGLTMAAFAFQGEWDLVRTNLTYWPLLEVEPGRFKRFPDMVVDGTDDTSIDQYGEMLMGLTALALVGPPDLKAEAGRITSDIINYGLAHDWKMGGGPYVDCHDIRLLFHLLSLRLNLGLSALDPGETFEQARYKFFAQFGQALFVRRTPRYFTLNLFFERMFVAKLLKPDLDGLDAAVATWYKVVKNDNDTMFDWFAARVAGRDTSFVIDKLRAFPPQLPNEWLDTGYHVNYRWERSPEQIAEPISGEPLERTGMDFFALASFYSYFAVHDF